jgi:hypothetical protein
MVSGTVVEPHPNCKKLYRTLDSLRRRRGIKGKLDEEDPSLKTSSKLKECEACLDFVVEEAFPQQKITSSCAHELTVCNHCVATSVDIQIQEAEGDHIECPQCDQNLTYEVVKKWESPRVFERCDIHCSMFHSKIRTLSRCLSAVIRRRCLGTQLHKCRILCCALDRVATRDKSMRAAMLSQL